MPGILKGGFIFQWFSRVSWLLVVRECSWSRQGTPPKFSIPYLHIAKFWKIQFSKIVILRTHKNLQFQRFFLLGEKILTGMKSSGFMASLRHPLRWNRISTNHWSQPVAPKRTRLSLNRLGGPGFLVMHPQKNGWHLEMLGGGFQRFC